MTTRALSNPEFAAHMRDRRGEPPIQLAAPSVIRMLANLEVPEDGCVYHVSGSAILKAMNPKLESSLYVVGVDIGPTRSWRERFFAPGQPKEVIVQFKLKTQQIDGGIMTLSLWCANAELAVDSMGFVAVKE